ncbi:MAG TPA: hypothetical protein VGM41_03230 [Chitinophagaceae bacterium]
MLVNFLIAIVIACGITAIVTFVLFGRARMKEEEQREKRFLRIHYTALFLLMLAGIILIFYMVGTSD